MYRLQDQDELFWGRRDDKAGYIHSFTTRREHHNQGIGRRILEDIETALKAEKKEYLRLDCGRDNPGLRAYYERYGFQNAGEIRVEGETLNLYEKALS
jgi:ribosomal protein S18 acetylase RimI-like enzyme